MSVQDNYFQWHPGMTLAAAEEKIILMAYKYFRGNKTLTANSLGIAIRTLDYKLENYSLDLKRKERVQKELVKKKELILEKQRGNFNEVNQAASVQFGFPKKDKTLGVEEVKEVKEEALIPEEIINHETEDQQNASDNTTYEETQNQPTIEISSESPLPVSVQEEVQEVLPPKPPKVRRGRKKRSVR
jgi:hypothetical protein